jgi:hypothetical protein
MPDLAIGIEGYACFAPADGHHDFPDVFGARVRQSDGVAETGGVEPVACKELIIEAGKVSDVRMPFQEVGHFVERSRAFGTLHLECDARGIQEGRNSSSHLSQVFQRAKRV